MRTSDLNTRRNFSKAAVFFLLAKLSLLLGWLALIVRLKPKRPRLRLSQTIATTPARLPFPLAELREVPSGPPETIVPVSLTLDITHQCPFRCPGCIEAGPMNASRCGELSTTTACRIIDRFADAGGRELLLYGGEPTYHHQFDWIVRRAGRRGLDLRLVTNGSQLACPRVYGALLAASNSTRVAVRVSLNAGTPATHAALHRAPSRFARIVEGLKTITQGPIDVQIGLLLQEANARELRKAYNVAAEVGARALVVRAMTGRHGIGLVPLSRAARNAVLRAVADLSTRRQGPAFHIEPWHLEFLATGRQPQTRKEYLGCYYCGAARLVITPPEPGVVWSCPYWRNTPAFHVANLERTAFLSAEFERLRHAAIRRIDPRRHCRQVICNRHQANQKIYAAQNGDHRA